MQQKTIHDPDSYLARECIRESFDAVIDYKPSSNDLELQRLVHFVFSNKLIADGENPVDCVIRELAEKHNIDTRTDEEKSVDKIVELMTLAYSESNSMYPSNYLNDLDAKATAEYLIKNGVKWAGE